MNDQERQDYLLGHVTALACAIRALIDHHPQKESVLTHFGAHLQQTGDLALPDPISEAYWNGLEAIRAYLLAPPDEASH
ncbi:hypothetical protein AB3X91_30690 [Paraburkholderia sp. BR14263]|uniref:hypothetical protein n=1 Tax=unclassified Paraburkholderia TaxID=2615204 RepID=UPI0034CE63FF